MKIAFLSRYQDTVNRGAETYVKELSSRLSKQHQVEILSGKESDSLSKVLQGNFDIVIPINGGLQSFKISIGRLFKRYKMLISGQAGIGRGEIWNIFFTKPNVYIALTDHMENWAKKWSWGSRVVKIPNGIDLEKFSPNGPKIKLNLPKPVILSVGALVWYKYHERVIKAVSKLSKGSLLIVGKGEKIDELKRLGLEKLSGRFEISNYEYEDMPKVYRSVDLFTLPSWEREAFGIAYLEALASGLPVVAPDDLSRREIVGETGVFVDVRDADKYAQAIKKCLETEWANESRKQAEKFSWENISNEYERVMLEMLSK